jgi:hypothetical protein
MLEFELDEKQMVYRVRKGIKFLNSVKPGWHKKIRLKNLNLLDDGKCILAQVEGYFYTGVYNLFAPKDGDATDQCECIDIAAPYGFAIENSIQDKLSDREDAKLHRQLTNVWKSEIKKFHAARKLAKDYYE